MSCWDALALRYWNVELLRTISPFWNARVLLAFCTTMQLLFHFFSYLSLFSYFLYEVNIKWTIFLFVFLVKVLSCQALLACDFIMNKLKKFVFLSQSFSHTFLYKSSHGNSYCWFILSHDTNTLLENITHIFEFLLVPCAYRFISIFMHEGFLWSLWLKPIFKLNYLT